MLRVPVNGMGIYDMEESEFDLKSLRESKGLTLKEVFERTRISVINLEAIENGDFHVLPPPVITRSFIKTYAKALEVESGKILFSYEQYLETLKSPSQKGEVHTASQTGGKKSKYVVWSLFILIGAGIIAFSMSSYKSVVDIPKSQIGGPAPSSSEVKPPESASTNAMIQSGPADQATPVAPPEERDRQSTHTSQTTQVGQESPGGVNIQQGVLTQEIKQQEPATGETYPLIMEAKELTWIRITAGQSQPEEILLNPGERIERSASNFVIIIGNAGGIHVDFQGKPLENLGNRGQVVHLKLP